MADRLLILGASARAAAASARRAGFEPFAIDLFADADTQRICDCLKCPPEDYPHGLFRLARQAPPMPWMYTGGLENYPELVDELTKQRKLLGNFSRLIEPVRNPFVLNAVFSAHGIPTPAVLPVGGPPPGDDPWLGKRLLSSAGHGISWFDYSHPHGKADYLQRYVPGTAMSAVYVSMPWRVYLIAATLQLVGQPWLHARPFAYCGNIGSYDLPDATLETLRSVGNVVTQYGPKFGLFGVDFVLDTQHRPHIIEVNPRYPASVEILDHAYGEAFVKWHVECANALAEEDDETEWREPSGFARRSVVGKAIYYAPHRLTVPPSGPWDVSLAHAADVWRRPDFADIPHAGDVIERGHPVLTILTEAATEADCLARLQSRASDLDRLFGSEPMTLNERANHVADELEANADALRVAVSRVGGARVIDCGGGVTGSLSAGLLMARACLADLADVAFVPDASGPAVQVRTDDPVRACLASQYAGWQVSVGKFFGMGSGPMRAAYAKEEIFHHIPGKEESSVAVGVIETRKHPTEEVIAHLVAKLPTTVEKLTLLVAPASSLAGNVQVVARSVETVLHKLHELKFDVTQVVSGYGVAPLPPVAAEELAAIGRTNDAILYGGRVTLWVRADDELIESVGPKVPSSSSKDHGRLFAELFAQYGDFYKIDPLLSPAEVTFVNLKTGRCHAFGRTEPGLLRKSFFGE